jgi:S1-C subfamily serine protease
VRANPWRKEARQLARFVDCCERGLEIDPTPTLREPPMVTLLHRLGLTVGLLVFGVSSAISADKPTRVEIGKQGKAATAFADVPGRGTGTAFCVHPSGLFVTNEHVIRSAEKAEITLVLDPSLPTERVLKAKVVRVDQSADLALLRVDGVEDLPSLPLGSVEGVAELADVVACGFPLGRILSTDKKEYPAISVNAGTVTALRHKMGVLQSIQIDVALTFGNSGGPVLDENGKVIGVVVSGIVGAKGINQAIPVSHLERFLKAPDLAVIPPELTREGLDKPQVFKARAVSFVPKSPEPGLRLILQASGEEPREFPMKKQGTVWVASAVPVGLQTGSRLEISVRMGSGTVSGTTDDAVIKVGGKVMRLSGVRRMEWKPRPSVLLADGRTTVEGEITGLRMVEIDLGGQKVTLDLSKATQLTVQSVVEVVSVTATVIATVEGKEVGRTESRLAVRDPARLSPADPATVAITPPALTGDKVVKRLPEGFSEVVVGGGGRYLIFHLPKLKKLAVFDVNEGRVTKYIPLTETTIAFAAGLDAVVVGLRSAGKLERWSLTTFELEKSAATPFQEEIGTMLMGHGSNGPVVVNGYFLDLATFRPLPILDPKGQERPLGGGWRIPSGDGTVYGGWNTHLSPSSATSFVMEGSVVKRYDSGDLRHVVPGPDGRTVYTGKGICAATLERGNPDDASYGYCLPAVRGEYFLSLTSATGGKGGGFTVYLRGLKQPIAKLDKAEHGLSFDGWDRESFGPWRRVYFIPDAKVIAVLPPSNDQVVLYKFDADAALEKSGQDYLLVTSQPPAQAKVGALLTYPVKVKSKQAKVTFKFDAGPKGMEVSASGVLTWQIPPDAVPGEEEVILTVKDGGGQEVFHTFKIRITK